MDLKAKELFDEFSTPHPETREPILSLGHFVSLLAPFQSDIPKLSTSLLYLIADHDQKGYINEADWTRFVTTLTSIDGEFKVLYNFLSSSQSLTSRISYDKCIDVLNKLNKSIDANYQQKTVKFNWAYFQRFFEPHGSIEYDDFITLINYLPVTKLIGNFEILAGKNGVITDEQIVALLESNLAHKLSSRLKGNLSNIIDFFPTSSSYTLANVLFIYNALNKVDLINEVIANTPPTNKDKDDIVINKVDLYNHLNDHLLKSSNFRPVSITELNLLFHLINRSDDNIPRKELISFLNPNFENNLAPMYAIFDHPNTHHASKYKFGDDTDNFSLYPIFDSLYSFFLGSIAGCIGATVVYPIDLVKTRMQAQKHKALYNNSMDCFRKIIKAEGLKGLYSGLGAQLVGVAPEKAIKLTVNDLVRKIGSDPESGSITMSWEIAAGMSAGACQVILTNPLEIVKIRLQMQGGSKAVNPGEIPHKRLNASQIIRQLGLKGLYKGASACLLRDVPFSAIYFPTYANLKKYLFGFDPSSTNKNHRLSSWQLLVSGALAGAPAAFFTTPADVIKTRLQVESKSHEVKYRGIIHAGSVILKEEGFGAFFKGSIARVFRSSPQFGFTLASYELLQNLFPLNPPITKESNFKAISGYPGIYNLTNDQVYNSQGKNERIMYLNKSELLGEGPVSTTATKLNDTLVKLPAEYIYKSQDAIKLLLDIDYKFCNFDSKAYENYIRK